jgi:hypothetical protein
MKASTCRKEVVNEWQAIGRLQFDGARAEVWSSPYVAQGAI